MIETKKLSNGISVVLEELPHFNSVGIAVWVKTGSACETKSENGISHFIEHMLFKGTEKRTAKDIAIEMDSIGGQVNAFTSKECTCYHARVVYDKIETAVDVLSDLVKNSKIDESELDKERLVVLEEISMVNDHPDDLAHEHISINFFEGSEYSKPIIGPSENIQRFKRVDLKKYMEKHYYPENMVISVAGKMDKTAMMTLLEEYFADYKNLSDKRYSEDCSSSFIPKKSIITLERDIEQTHISLGFNGVSFTDETRFAYMVLSNLFGGSMSSRLFQKIREEMGLVYSVYSYLSTYTHAGMFGLYAATGAKKAEVALDIMQKEIINLKESGVSDDEFINSKTQLHGNYLLALESVNARVQSIGKSALLLGYVDSQKEILAKLEKVSKQDVNDLVNFIFDFDKMNAVFVGKILDKQKLEGTCL